MLYFVDKEDGSPWLQPRRCRQHSEGNRGDLPRQKDIRHAGRSRAANALRDGHFLAFFVLPRCTNCAFLFKLFKYFSIYA